MKVLHITYSDTGGAGNAAMRTHQALLDHEIDSLLLVQKKTTALDTVIKLGGEFWRERWRKIRRHFEKKYAKNLIKSDARLRSCNRLPGFILSPIKRLKPDIVHLHWVNQGMMSLKEIARIPVPVVWTAHDMWPITGSCHCMGSLVSPSRVKEIPHSMGEFDSTGFCKTQEALYQREITGAIDVVLTLNKAFEKAAKASPAFESSSVVRLPNCINTSRYHVSVCQQELRKNMGLPADKIILLFGAAGISQPHKGMDLLIESLALLPRELTHRYMILVAGGHTETPTNVDMEYRTLGHISDESDIIELYQASDILLCPSREDNLPNMVAEAALCGLPTVAFHTGGLPDMIQQKKSGYLAEPFDTDDFAKGILHVAERKEAMGQSAREFAENLYDPVNHAQQLSRIYRELIDTSVLSH